ncbi:hypothetical protein BC829DRAFT_409571 [Chytridium lagenaria]|nr:hypothetical protein BC829DRAFT_409571 [Chytridium lagenaria]
MDQWLLRWWMKFCRSRRSTSWRPGLFSKTTGTFHFMHEQLGTLVTYLNWMIFFFLINNTQNPIVAFLATNMFPVSTSPTFLPILSHLLPSQTSYTHPSRILISSHCLPSQPHSQITHSFLTHRPSIPRDLADRTKD